ncbi:MAG: SdrD B-like domain-containing protein [Pirellulaceae bacterium]
MFVFDRVDQSIRRVNVSDSGEESNAFTYAPVISGNGRYVAFQSLADNLVGGDTNQTSDLFVVDLDASSIERLEIPFEGSSQTFSFAPSISDDGQYIAFEAPASLADPTVDPSLRSLFVYDRLPKASPDDDASDRLALVSEAPGGQREDEQSRRVRISGDGRWLAFESTSTNLISNDSNAQSDIFVAPNPFENASRGIVLHAGQELMSLDIGLLPEPGSIRGTVFNDQSSDGALGLGDLTLEGWTVYLDLNNNQRHDDGEPTTVSGIDGTYEFHDVVSFREYAVGTQLQAGWQSTGQTQASHTQRVFLPAGGDVGQVNFGFRVEQTGGQSTNGRIEGAVFRDVNEDGLRQPDEVGIRDVVVFLDLDGDEERDFNEPQAVTDQDGKYSFANLGARSYSVRIQLTEGNNLTAPVGNQFSASDFEFSTTSTSILTPQDVVVADFDGSSGPDTAIALYSANAIAIQLNDGLGNFDREPLIVETPGTQGPLALASGDLDASGATDLVVAGALNNTVTVLLDFQGDHFSKTTTLSLTGTPTDLALLTSIETMILT